MYTTSLSRSARIITASAPRPVSRATRSIHLSLPLSASTPSPLEVRLRDGLKTSMKARDKPASTLYKSILADVTNAAKSGPTPGEPLDEDGVINTLKKGISNRALAAQSYSPDSTSPSPEHYDSLQNEITLLQSYLPESPCIESVQQSITGILAELTEEVRVGKGAMGVVLKTLWERLGDGGKGLDRKEVGKLVSEALKKK